MGPLPLEGVRVVDLTWVIAGPRAGRLLAFMGAEVIKIGSARRPEFKAQVYNQSKLSCALNISTSEGLELVKRIVEVSDLVVDNFSSGAMERIGLGYEVLRARKPDIVMVSSSGLGHSGPNKDFVGYGSLLQHYTGWNSMSGYPGRIIRGGLWADPWVAIELAMVATAALDHRIRAGEGQYVDFSMAEALMESMSGPLLDYQMNRREKGPIGNRDERYAPHGAYHCRGEDRWVAIAVTNDAEWNGLCDVIQRPDLVLDDRFANMEGRIKLQDELDAAITEWTLRHTDYQAARLLQAAGVPAGPSLDSKRVLHAPLVREATMVKVESGGEQNSTEFAWMPWQSDDQQEPRFELEPTLGQHNDYVYRELLGLSEAEIELLVEKKVIY